MRKFTTLVISKVLINTGIYLLDHHQAHCHIHSPVLHRVDSRQVDSLCAEERGGGRVPAIKNDEDYAIHVNRAF